MVLWPWASGSRAHHGRSAGRGRSILHGGQIQEEEEEPAFQCPLPGTPPATYLPLTRPHLLKVLTLPVVPQARHSGASGAHSRPTPWRAGTGPELRSLPCQACSSSPSPPCPPHATPGRLVPTDHHHLAPQCPGEAGALPSCCCCSSWSSWAPSLSSWA